MGKTTRVVLDTMNAKLAPEIAAALEEMSGQRMGFVLFTFDFGQCGDGAFISNADRDGLRAAIAELLDQLDNAVLTTLPRPPESKS